MNDTWRFIVVITLIFAVSALLPFVAEAGTLVRNPLIGSK